MLTKILAGVAVVIVLLIGFIASRPSTFHIERSATISAPADVVFASINDFHRWPAWSPWEGMDPQMKKTYDGATSGAGSVYSWVGNDKVGEGRMTIMESRRPDLVSIKLEFLKPWQATNTCNFKI